MLDRIVIAIGSDHVGYKLKEKIRFYFQMLNRADIDIVDCGCEGERIDFPLIAKKVCEKIQNGEATHGILASGAGYDMCVAANKYSGVRAVNTNDIGVVKLARQQCNVNVLCVAALVHGSEYQLNESMRLFLDTEFSSAARHVRRVTQMESALNPTPISTNGDLIDGNNPILKFGGASGNSAFDQVASIANGLIGGKSKTSDQIQVK